MNRENVILAYYNKYTNEIITMLINPLFAQRYCETIEGQGCKAGYWSLEYWQRVKNHVLYGNYLKR